MPRLPPEESISNVQEKVRSGTTGSDYRALLVRNSNAERIGWRHSRLRREDVSLRGRARSIAGALRRGGFFGPGTAFPEILDDRLHAVHPVSGETRPLRMPAFSARLKNPINVFEHRFTRWPRSDDGAPDPGQPASDPNDSFNGPGANKPIRYLSRRIGASPGQAYGTRTSDAALPAGQAFAPGRPTTFDDRFANWTDSDGAMAPLAPNRAPPQEDNRPRGIFSGKPMPSYPVPPPIFGFPEPGAPEDEDRLLQLLAPRRGDNEIDGPYGYLARLREYSEIAKLAFDPSGKSVA
jgi:hypothetical protein